ncbi:MAG: hypothetical protein ACYCW6_06180, partial [Candidatus Xenobia bacterium]
SSQAGAPITFNDVNTFTVGSVAPAGCFRGACGIRTSNGCITLGTCGGLTLSQGLNAGTGTVRLKGSGNVLEQCGSAINAANLGAISCGSVSLGQKNVVCGNVAISGKCVTFNDTKGFTVGSVSAVSPFPATAGVQASNGNVTLTTCGALTLAQAVSSTCTVRLASGGAVNESGSRIAGANLGVTSGCAITLPGANTVTGTVALNSSQAGAPITFNDVNTFTVGSVAPAGGFRGACGIRTSNGCITLSTCGGLTLSQGLNAGTGTVRLKGRGNVLEECGSAINAANLGVSSCGTVALGEKNTVCGNVALQGKCVTFTDTKPFTIGSVNGVTGITAGGSVTLTAPAITETCVAINSGSLSVSTCAPIVLNGQNQVTGGVALTAPSVSFNDVDGFTVAAITSGPVTLTSGGDVVQTGIITACNLNLTAKGNVNLPLQNKVSGTLSACAPSIAFENAGSLTAGALTTCNGNVSLNSGGNLTLTGPIKVGTGTIGLAAKGCLTQTTAVTSGNLGVVGCGNVNLSLSNAVPGNVAIDPVNLTFNDSDSFTIGTIPAFGVFPGASGVTSSGNATVTSAGTITLAQPVVAGGGVNLTAQQGSLSGGLVVAGASSTISAPNGSVGVSGNPLSININGNLTVQAADSVVLSGTLTGELLLNGQPNNPPLLNGQLDPVSGIDQEILNQTIESEDPYQFENLPGPTVQVLAADPYQFVKETGPLFRILGRAWGTTLFRLPHVLVQPDSTH